jgi:hypothetical protein
LNSSNIQPKRNPWSLGAPGLKKPFKDLVLNYEINKFLEILAPYKLQEKDFLST